MPPLFVDEDIAVAKTLSTDFYLDPEYFEEAKRKIFSQSWYFIGTDNLVAETNDCYPFTLMEDSLNEPLVLTKDKEGEIRCLSNVCTHRGNILVTKACNQPHIRCRYHGRVFHQDGTFRSMPEFKEVKNFPSPADDLTSLPIYKLGNWLFTSLNKTQSSSIFFDEMISRLNWIPLEEFSKATHYKHLYGKCELGAILRKLPGRVPYPVCACRP